MKMKKLLSSLFSVLVIHLYAQAQPQSGVPDSIYSEILKEKRTISVVLPADYKEGSSTKYDVVYAIDGDWNALMISQIEGFLRESGFMPKTIVVGINNTNRNRDLTPTGGENPAANGGAANFLNFFEKELIPYINKKYPTKGNNILFGHSLGGLFAMYALLTKPQLFETYIAADPSFWWDKGYMSRLAAEKLDTILHANKSLWIAGRGGRDSENMGIPSVDSVLKAKNISGLNWKVAEYPGETHNSVKFKSVYDGLKFAYAGYDLAIEFHPQNGVVQKDKPVKIWCFTCAAVEARYTTNGTDPLRSSPRLGAEIELNGPASLRIKSFTPRGSFDKMISGEFKSGGPMRSIPKPANAKQGGLRYNYYEGEWDSLPDFKKLKPAKTGIADKDFGFDKLPKQINFACVFEGYIEIKEDGYHIFGLNSDDGSKLYIGNQLLIDYNGLHGSDHDHSYIVPLEKGFYPIRLEYFQREGGLNLNLIYVTPGIKTPTPTRIPPEVMYSN
jgi:predicted alpha/beta superfamily hydrolase